ncbi:MAG: hypothetical protein ACR2IE_19565 [Candidatus Sumerlaeaceae bacterium]
MILPEDFRPARDPKMLLKEVDAAIRVKDIQKIHRYRERIERQWWESGIVIMLFISGLGFIITIYKLIPISDPRVFWFVFLWFSLFVLTLIATLEIVLSKISALRALYEINSKLIEELERRLPPDHTQPHV